MSTLRTRMLLVCCSSLAGLFLAQLLWKNRPVPPTVLLVDNSAHLERAIQEKVTRSASGDRTAAPPQGIWGPDLQHERLDEETTRKLFAVLRKGGKGHVYDPLTYYWEAANFRHVKRFPEHHKGGFTVRTNQMGFRKSCEVLEDQPDLRILVTGDSHTAGIVPNDENFVQGLEASLSSLSPDRTIEGLNAGKGGYSFYSYLGVLEKFLSLKPDVFVLTCFGGNDFKECTALFRYYNSLPPYKLDRMENRKALGDPRQLKPGMWPQDLGQVSALASSSDRYRAAEAAPRQITARIKEICDSNGIRFLFVYVPPSMDAQPQIIRDDMDRARAVLGLDSNQMKVTERLANGLLEFLKSIDVETIDMRPTYQQHEELVYWATDLHINTEGHRLIAEQLSARLEGMLLP